MHTHEPLWVLKEHDVLEVKLEGARHGTPEGVRHHESLLPVGVHHRLHHHLQSRAQIEPRVKRLLFILLHQTIFVNTDLLDDGRRLVELHVLLASEGADGGQLVVRVDLNLGRVERGGRQQRVA